jgi:pimeloyl-ACP methyl ester carboxylesterase
MSTFVFIHGAGCTAWDWHLVEPELRKRGHDVVAVDLPCDDPTAGLAEYVDAVLAAIGDRTDLVVVAHSLGGFTAPLVCARVPADQLVLVAAMIPAPGETADDWWANSGHAEAFTGRDYDERELFFHDIPDELATEALTRSRDQTGPAMSEPWPLDAWPDVPTRVLAGRNDRLFPFEPMRRLARERIGVEADAIDTGHTPALARPEELAERLDAYAA